MNLAIISQTECLTQEGDDEIVFHLTVEGMLEFKVAILKKELSEAKLRELATSSLHALIDNLKEYHSKHKDQL